MMMDERQNIFSRLICTLDINDIKPSMQNFRSVEIEMRSFFALWGRFAHLLTDDDF